MEMLRSLRQDQAVLLDWHLSDLEALARHGSVLSFTAGDALFHRGEVASWSRRQNSAETNEVLTSSPFG